MLYLTLDTEDDAGNDRYQALHCYDTRHRSTVVHWRHVVVSATPEPANNNDNG